MVQAAGVGAVREEGGVGGGGGHRAQVGEGAQQSGRGAHPGGVGLPVQGVLIGQAIETLRNAHEGADAGQQPDRAGGVHRQQRQTARDLDETADHELAADGFPPSGDAGDDESAQRQRQQDQPGTGSVQPAPLLHPLREPVEEGVRGGVAEELAQEGGEHRSVAAEHSQVDERGRNAEFPPGEGGPGDEREHRQVPVGGPRSHQEQHQRDEQCGEQGHADEVDTARGGHG